MAPGLITLALRCQFKNRPGHEALLKGAKAQDI